MSNPITLGSIIEDTKSAAFLGISDRDVILGYIERALSLGIYEENYNPSIGTLDTNSDACGWVTLPYFVGTVLATNVAGQPSIFRNAWFEYSQNGPGSFPNNGNAWGATGWYGAGTNTAMGSSWNGQSWDDREFSPTFRDLAEWSTLAAITENPADGAGNLKLIVTGETQNALGDPQVVTREIPLLANTASQDTNVTLWRKITRVLKPVTQGYVKLLGCPPHQGARGVVVGYYSPRETTPNYRRIRVSQSCCWVRVRYRLADVKSLYDYDILPISNREAMLELIKSIRLSDTNNLEASEAYRARAIDILNKVQSIEDGPGTFQIQVNPGYGVGTRDIR